MSLINKSTKLFKIILLSTIFITPNIRCYGADQIEQTDSPKPVHYIQTKTINLAVLCYDIIFDTGIKILNNSKIPLENKIAWIEKAFGNLKEMTDIARPIKYANKLDIPEFTENLSQIKDWNAETRSFNSEKFHFQYTVPNPTPNSDEKFTKKNILISDIHETEITDIITLLLIKLTKKATYLKAFSKIKEVEYDLMYNAPSERDALICELFRTKHQNNKIKKNLLELNKEHLGNKGGKANYSPIHKIKILYDKQTDETIKHTEIKLRLEKSWEVYLKGIELIKKPSTSEQTKTIIRNNLAKITLPTAMKDVEVKYIYDSYCYLTNRNRILEEIFQIAKADTRKEHFNLKATKNQFNTHVLNDGQQIMHNLKRFSLENKKSWILEACSSLKIFEDEINGILYGPSYDRNMYSYPCWDKNTRLFLDNKNSKDNEAFKFALPLLNDDNPSFLKLRDLDESYADTILIPILLTQLFKKNQECVFWEGKINEPINSTPTNDLSDPQGIVNEILGLLQNKAALEIESKKLLDTYLEIMGFTPYDANLRNNPKIQAPEFIDINRVASKIAALFDKLIIDASQYGKKFNANVKKLNLGKNGVTRKENEPLLEKVFLKFQNSLLSNHKLSELIDAISIIRYNNSMISQLNATILLNIKEKKNEGIRRQKEEIDRKLNSIPKNVSEMTSRERMRSKLLQKAEAKSNPNTPKMEKIIEKDPEPISNLPQSTKLKSVNEAPHQKTKKKKKFRHKTPNTAEKLDLKPLPSLSTPTEDSIKFVTLSDGTFGVSVPGIPYTEYNATQTQEKRITPKDPKQVPEPKKIETRQQQSRPGPVSSNKKSINPQRPLHQTQVKNPQTKTWSTVVEGITPPIPNNVTADITFSQQLVPITTPVETPPVLHKIPQEIVVPAITSIEPQTAPPATKQKDLVPVLKNGTTFYKQKTDEIYPQYSRYPQTENRTPVIYNYMVPGSSYDHSNLFVPHTDVIIPSKDVDQVIVQIATPKDQNTYSRTQNKKMKKINHDQEVKVVTHVYHHYPEATKNLEDLPTQQNAGAKQKNPTAQAHQTNNISSEVGDNLPRYPFPSRRKSLGDLSSESFYRTMNK